MIAFTALVFKNNASFQLAVCLLIMFTAYVMQVRYKPYMGLPERAQVIKEYGNFQTKMLELDVQRQNKLLEKKRSKMEILASGGGAAIAPEPAKKASKWAAARSMKAGIAAKGRKGSVADPTALADEMRAIIDQQREAKLKIAQAKSDVKESVNMVKATKALFFNLNTVEAVLLACAVLVNLFGVMFESNRLRSDKYAEERDLISYMCMVTIGGAIGYWIVVFISEIIGASKIRKEKSKMIWRKALRRKQVNVAGAGGGGGRGRRGRANSGGSPALARSGARRQRTRRARASPMLSKLKDGGGALTGV